MICAAGDAVHLGLQILQDLRLRALRSSHGLNRMPVNAWCTSPPMPLMANTCSFSGTVVEHIVEVAGDLLEVVDVGRRRRLDQIEQDALVFLGRQLLLRRGVHEHGGGDDADEDSSVTGR